MKKYTSLMNARIRQSNPKEQGRSDVVSGLYGLGALCLVWTLAGCQPPSQAAEVPTIPPKAKPTPEMLAVRAPPLVITRELNADWDGPQVIDAPTVRLEMKIAAPVLEPVAGATELVAQSDALDELDVPDIAQSIVVEELEAPAELPPGITFLDAFVPAGRLVQTTWTAGESLHGAQIPTPVLVANGVAEGPTLCVTAAVHGDELNGIESVRRLMYSIKPDKLRGKVIGVPIVNLQGFQRHSRYLSDRRDLNRFFPGNPRGSSASRMAYSFFNDVIMHCDGLVDLHTGSFHRTNLPQLRADLNNADVLALTKGFGSTVILHSDGGVGTLRRSAADAGIPAVTLEAGEPLRLQDDAVNHAVKAVFTLLDTMNMYDKRSLWGNPEPTYYSSLWIRADQGGILLSDVRLGRRVKVGDLLGTVTDPISNEQVGITAPYAGRVIGMALNQFVMPGFATFHIAAETDLGDVATGAIQAEHAEGLDVAISESQGAEESEE